MRKFVLVLFLTILVFQTLGQQPTKAVKISDFDDRFESISNFKEKTKILMRKLLESPSGTKAFIAIRTIRYYTDLRLRETAQAVLAQYPQTAGRVEIFRSGYTYFPRFENTELWLVPPGTESPYKGAIVDRVRCPSIELFG